MGTGTSFDLKSKFPDTYQRFTADNFIIGIQSMPLANGQLIRDAGENVQGTARGFTISKSYSDGILTISGISQHVGMIHGNGSQSGNWSSQQGVAFAYLVTGNINANT